MNKIFSSKHFKDLKNNICVCPILSGDKWGEVDTRFSFCAVAALTLLGELNAIDIDAAVEFVKSCMNFDGGFGTRPGSESHAG